ncbi:tetratricopeptide repeat protein [Spongiactinospora sp. TRM90649]|uniref:tetratricopeptide repeat protein n=1 Tax=Spongiactinospora sp. TRM90649 TaxID=3031114 RepID=UPI0023F7CBCC|nr:tetratricopeptide repeat protein [Spongiactinospora sp. TRM90649]MDF5755676.1 tetratricopeptide repeat protein [Spongiactinospora sp. TRM90649]
MGDEELRKRLADLLTRDQGDPEVLRQLAYANDALGNEHEALPYYERALAAGASDRLGMWTGYGSTLRVCGRYEEALAAFDEGLTEFPGDRGLRAFRAMALHNLGKHQEAVQDLLRLLAEGRQVGGYERAVEFYARDLGFTV